MCTDSFHAAACPGTSARDLFARARLGVLADRPAYVTLLGLLTLGGRVPYGDAVESLTVMERSVLEQIIGDEALRLRPPAPNEGARSDASRRRELLVAYSPQGRLSLLDLPEKASPDTGDVIARLPLPAPVWERAEETYLAWRIAEGHQQAQLDTALHHWEAAGSLPARVRQAADWTDHVETVLVHIGRQVFSRSDAGTSTLHRDRPLDDLADRPLSCWSPEERLFVMAVHVLFATGRSIRFEEFNGRRLSATALRAWLVSTWCGYAHALGREIPADLPARPFLPLAKEVGDLAAEVDASDWIRFRRIIGATFAKREVVVALPRRERRHDTPPPTLAALAERLTDMASPAPHGGPLPGPELVTRMVGTVLAGPPGGRVRLLEELLATLVHSAVRDLNADYGMTSAIRDLRRLGGAMADHTAGPLALRKPDFFCCVLPHPERLHAIPDADLRRLLWRVAQRMQYNRWHFVPGNFDRADVPSQRHYFFPPTLPDLAESADLWHGGHVAAGVRHSLRAPAAQLWQKPLAVGDNGYRGSHDLRVVRMSDEPFVRADLWLAVRYSALIDAFWRAIATGAARDPAAPYPVITAFDRRWYEDDEWKVFAAAPYVRSSW
ncbi:hypothetical protein QFZ75_008074 [Streptomyces sp. V3I8]|uniref:hypothetical protein n=1 Tax=Streptomyces sp. V3I8 TaxID=3042279 RepID=UPI002787AAD3|nr:hypothetical protein [Streptomyces sp. V3I8]MDQ1041572.1 hypothetical protein [Streptomyces sp. V3I8]